jgi:hypothetical protein
MSAEDFPAFDENAAAIVENGYDVVPLVRGQKNPVPKGWQNYQFKETDLREYRGCGIGLLTRRTPVIDSDVKHERAAAEIAALVEAQFGPAPRRIGAAPKAAWVLQLEGPDFTKLQTRDYRLPGDVSGDKYHRVEILAAGQQLVAYNIHPDTHKPYVWNGAGEPLQTPIGLLPPITHAHAQEFIAQAEAILAYHGVPVVERTDKQRANGQGNGHEAGAKQGPGSRNSTLTKMAGSMRRSGFSAAAIGEALHKENFERYDPPLPGAEINGICEQAAKWEQGATGATPTPCAPIDWDTLTGEPPPRIWWMQDWLGPSPILTAGAGGAGKTRLWQAIGTALATGQHYLAASVAPLKVLMWLCEDTRDEMWRRQAAINAHFGLTMGDLKGRLHIVPRQGRDNTLLDLVYGKPTFTPLLDELHQQVCDFKADVLVLDNLAQLYGGNENDRHQSTFFVNGIAGLVPDRAFAPVFLGHVARSAGSEFSGSAAWENACRMRWYVGPTLPDQPLEPGEAVDPDVMYLAKRKANYTAKEWRRLRFRNGLFVPDEPEGRRFDQASRDDTAERVLLEAMPRLMGAGIVPTDGRTSGDYLPAQAVAKGYAQGHSKKDLAAAMHRLMGAGRLRRQIVGKDSSRHPRYGLALP